ncbi:hypothetical protein Glove_362g11 [Diversispora epigaea]|uniref:Uncharacterized protein n=1 Tax=Diversispora epigaea TaxID=1348612 RepID=A0A397HEG7_9GLOM|nr:hypothetical protein Glove_362g11 [Diversispora epigaea]
MLYQSGKSNINTNLFTYLILKFNFTFELQLYFYLLHVALHTTFNTQLVLLQNFVFRMLSKKIGTLTALAGVVAVSASVIISAFEKYFKIKKQQKNENADKINEKTSDSQLLMYQQNKKFINSSSIPKEKLDKVISKHYIRLANIIEETNDETKNESSTRYGNSFSILQDSQRPKYQQNKPFISSPLVPKEKQQKLNKVISKRYIGLANTSTVTLGAHDENQCENENDDDYDQNEHFDQSDECGEYDDVNKYYNDESDNDLEDNAKYYELEDVNKYFEVHDGCDYIDTDKGSDEESDEDQEKYFGGYANEEIANYNGLEDVSKYFKYFEVHDGCDEGSNEESDDDQEKYFGGYAHELEDVGKYFEVHDGCNDIGEDKGFNKESDDDLEKYFDGYNTDNADGDEGSEYSDDDLAKYFGNYESDEINEYESDEDDEYFGSDEFENNECENVEYIDPNPKSGKIVKLEITEDEKRAATLNLVRSFEQLEKLLENEGRNVEIPRPDY